MSESVKYSLKITPAIPPVKYNMIEDTLKALGFHVRGGGIEWFTDSSECQISFEGPPFEELDK